MESILKNATEILLLLFLIITFLQSGIDKIVPLWLFTVLYFLVCRYLCFYSGNAWLKITKVLGLLPCILYPLSSWYLYFRP